MIQGQSDKFDLKLNFGAQSAIPSVNRPKLVDFTSAHL